MIDYGTYVCYRYIRKETKYEAEWGDCLAYSNTDGVVVSNNSFMICPINISELIIDAGNLIRRSFNTVAEEYGITKENCPTNPAFISDEKLTGQLSGDGNYCFGIFEGETLVGFVALAHYGDGYEITRLSVAPEKRHLGYGKGLIETAINKAREIGIVEIGIGIVDENAVLKQWYIGQGFTVAEVKKYPDLPYTVCAMSMKL